MSRNFSKNIMKKISDFLRYNPRYKRYQKPLEAARICEAARALADGRFGVISFRGGLLSLSVGSSAQAANLSAESEKIINELNKKIGQNIVERLRFKVV